MQKKYRTYLAAVLAIALVGTFFYAKWRLREAPPIPGSFAYWKKEIRFRLDKSWTPFSPLESEDAVVGLSPDQSLTLPILMELLMDEDAQIRRVACLVLAKLGPQAANAVPLLIDIVREKEAAKPWTGENTLRLSAMYALAMIGPKAKAAVPILEQILKNRESPDSIYSAFALYRIDRRLDLAMPVLVSSLDKSNPGRGQLAIVVLAVIGSDAKTAVPALLALKKQGDVYVDDALKKIDPESLVTYYMGQTTSNDRQARANALYGLLQLPLQPEMRIDVLEKDLVEGCRWSTLSELNRLGAKANKAVPTLTRILNHKDLGYRVMAAETLGKIGPGAKPAVPALISALNDQEIMMRLQARHALKKIDPERAAKLGLED